MAYLAVKQLHILSPTVLSGSGTGTVFGLLTAVLQRGVRGVAPAAADGTALPPVFWPGASP